MATKLSSEQLKALRAVKLAEIEAGTKAADDRRRVDLAEAQAHSARARRAFVESICGPENAALLEQDREIRNAEMAAAKPKAIAKPLADAPAVSAARDSADEITPALMWLAKAMLLVQNHPEWPDTKIADKVRIDKSQLSRSAAYQAAADVARKQQPTKKGSVAVDAETKKSTIEAIAESEGEESQEEIDARIDRETAKTQQTPQRQNAK